MQQSLTLEITNPETISALAEAARRQGLTLEQYALSLLETALLAQRPFEEIVEPVARSFEQSGMSDEDLNTLITETKRAVRAERRQKP